LLTEIDSNDPAKAIMHREQQYPKRAASDPQIDAQSCLILMLTRRIENAE
jgi:hypothetical protein